MSLSPSKTTTSDPVGVLLDVVRQLVAELHPGSGKTAKIALDSTLDRDFGLDSLSRMELLFRVEQAFGITLPEQTLVTAQTPRDLLRAVLLAAPATAPSSAIEARSPVIEGVDALPEQANTLIEVLDWHVRHHPDRPHILLLSDDKHEQSISHAELQQGATAVANALRQRDIAAGQAVALMLPTSREFFCCFFGILLAGCIPVPMYPPARAAQMEDHLRRHTGILSNAQAVALITLAEAKPLARLLKSQLLSLNQILTPDDLSGPAGSAIPTSAKAQDIAFLQYTSGSTGNPKGVVLTHANLLANIRAMGQAAQVTSKDVFVSWLPLYHDMGLIGAWFGSLYHACPLVVMAPMRFIARPSRWLRTIHKYRGTLSSAPNFAYELCLRRISDADIQGLDLSSWRMAFNGAEPVSPDTITRFAARFAAYGFQAGAIAPVYGLAESAVGLAFPPPGRGPIIDAVQREVFMRTGYAAPAAPGDSDVLRFVACGRPLAGHQLRVADDEEHEARERENGHLQFRGPSATSGYFRNPEQTGKLFHGDWLDTGDLAYMAGGDIYLTSRSKDIIIRAGRNISPYELEDAVGDLAGIRKGCVAVFGSPDPHGGTERLIVMAETREREAGTQEHLRSQINGIATSLLGDPPDDIVLVPPHSVLKTSSGKIRRAASREWYEQGRIGRGRSEAWRQHLRLWLAAILPQWQRMVRTTRRLLYAAYVWSVFYLLAPLVWPLSVALPRPAWSWTISHGAALLFQKLTATPFTVQGLAHLPADRPCVIVANHASYLDGMVMVAVLRQQMCFVAKQELQAQRIAGSYLKHLGSYFVERFDIQRGVEDTNQLARQIGRGQSLIFFPEGTFQRMAGLLPFHMGAFIAAAQAGAPVVPVTIRGTRAILRDESGFPRHGPIRVIIGAPILPEGTDWSAALRLRDQARAEILRHCDEADLG